MHSWEEMGIPTIASSFSLSLSMRRFLRVKVNMNFFLLR